MVKFLDYQHWFRRKSLKVEKLLVCFSLTNCSAKFDWVESAQLSSLGNMATEKEAYWWFFQSKLQNVQRQSRKRCREIFIASFAKSRRPVKDGRCMCWNLYCKRKRHVARFCCPGIKKKLLSKKHIFLSFLKIICQRNRYFLKNQGMVLGCTSAYHFYIQKSNEAPIGKLNTYTRKQKFSISFFVL